MGEARKDAGSKELWKSFIDMHEDLELMDSGKCRCKVTGHEMKPIKDVVEAHLNGKRYKKEKAKRAMENYNFEKYAPDIVQSKKDPRKLFCHLTKTVLNKVPEELELHVNGKRFKRRKEDRELLDAMRAQRKTKQPAEEDGDEDPLLKQFEGFDSAEEEEQEDDDEFEEGGEEKPTGKKPKKRLMPSIGAVKDDSGDDDFEEVVAADSDDEDDEDEEGEEEAPKEKLPWPVPEFALSGSGKRKRKLAEGGEGGEKKAKSEQKQAGKKAGEGEKKLKVAKKEGEMEGQCRGRGGGREQAPREEGGRKGRESSSREQTPRAWG